jgi:hydrogenase maturation protease
MTAKSTPMATPVLVGVGNPWRGDDGVGIAVVRAAAPRLADTRVDITEVDGEPARLVEIWDRRPLAVVVDAAYGGGEPGTVHRVEITSAAPDRLGPTSRHGGSHALGVADAVRLAVALDRLPGRLIALGIEGAAFAHTDGIELDPRVRDAVATAVEMVVEIFVEGARQHEEVAPCA